jgi:SAM-dependent methyltransferase
MKQPRQVATEQTVLFVQKHLKASNQKILEVGCGLGDVAKALQDLGHAVKAIDLDIDSVVATRAKGVEAEKSDIIHLRESNRYDCVLFTRSLHHINPIENALQNTFQALRPGGLLLVEDFAVERPDIPTLTWLHGLEGLLDKKKAVFSDCLARWQEEHKEVPPLHTGETMINEISKAFQMESRETCAYLYRQFVPQLTPLEDGYEMVQGIFEWEKALISSRLIQPTGLRIISRKK